MGFLSDLFGGSESQQQSSSQSGYNSIAPNIQAGFNQLGQGVSQFTNPNDPNVINSFTPLQQTAGETQAYNAINQGFAPTQQSLSSDLSMLMNPFNDSVIGGINNQAQGNFSILKQNQDQAGQFGSNRQTLGANDIELQRQNQIGSLLQNQYNTALGQVFNNIIPQQQQDAMNQLNAGANQRQLAYQTAQAPIAALQAGTSMISPFTSNSSNSSGTSSSNGGIFGGSGAGGNIANVGNTLSGVGGVLMASDIQLKEDIKYLGMENGHKLYEFKYKNSEGRYVGVMAQEVMEINPGAVENINGHLAVYYDRIGVEFRRVS